MEKTKDKNRRWGTKEKVLRRVSGKKECTVHVVLLSPS